MALEDQPEAVANAIFQAVQALSPVVVQDEHGRPSTLTYTLAEGLRYRELRQYKSAPPAPDFLALFSVDKKLV